MVLFCSVPFHWLFGIPIWRHLYLHLRHVARMIRLDRHDEFRAIAEFQMRDMIVEAVEMWATTHGA